LSELEAESQARGLARNYPDQEYAIARMIKIFRTESEVVAKSMGMQEDSARAAGCSKTPSDCSVHLSPLELTPALL